MFYKLRAWLCLDEAHNEFTGLEVIELEFIMRNDWLLADTCPQAANHCALF